MAVEMRALLEEARGPLPPRPERWRVGELVEWSKVQAPELEAAMWEVALGHERRAMDAASLEPGALDAVGRPRSAGFRTALWTHNARALTVPALGRLGLAALLDLVVTRDDMRALKPDPDGWRVICDRVDGAERAADSVVVGDSWVDGLAAAAVGVPFLAYRPRDEELRRSCVQPARRLDDLAALPAWLAPPGHGPQARP